MTAAKKLDIVEEEVEVSDETEDLLSNTLEADDFGGSHGLQSRPDEGEGNWLVSYADMMTLLVGFFVMLLSFSKIDTAQFEKVKQETTKLFGGEYQIPFEEFANKLEDTIKENGLSGQVIVHKDANGVMVTFRGALFFDSGSVVLKKEALELLVRLEPTITQHAKDFGIVVEGHTDDNPINSGLIVSNWELSGLRASTVLRFFLEKGFHPQKLKALGMADTQPILPNRDETGKPIPDNQSQNRRVVLKILKELQ